jgi:3-isopropylmalate dehydrogenase
MKKVAVIAGDGIGKEVIPVALKIVEAAGAQFDYIDFDLGGERYLKDGFVLDDKTVDELRGFDSILLGAVGHPGVTPGIIERGLLLKLRFDLDLYINRRPFTGKSHDFEVIRENTEGVYLGEGGVLRKHTSQEVATQGSINTRYGVERCIRYAFELARTRDDKKVTLVHKTNVLMYAGDLWQRTFDGLAKEFSDVATDYNHIDAACIYFVEQPERYSVIVTDNLFGDILTDLGGAVSGGIGLAASANLDPTRKSPSLFEPVHGSAPDIAGRNKANPIAAVTSAAMLCDWLDETEAASKIIAACKKVAPDTAGKSTTEISQAIQTELSR